MFDIRPKCGESSDDRAYNCVRLACGSMLLHGEATKKKKKLNEYV